MEDTFELLIGRILHGLLDRHICASPWLVPPIRSLPGHDAAGGHACQRHIGKSVRELRGRLISEPDISAASAFWTIESATASVCYLTGSNILEIIDWRCDRNSRRRITIDGEVPARTSVGYSLVRGANRIILCKKVRMILEKDVGHDFHIVTAFPMQ